jgi:hypothetical protein
LVDEVVGPVREPAQCFHEPNKCKHDCTPERDSVWDLDLGIGADVIGDFVMISCSAIEI